MALLFLFSSCFALPGRQFQAYGEVTCLRAVGLSWSLLILCFITDFISKSFLDLEKNAEIAREPAMFGLV